MNEPESPKDKPRRGRDFLIGFGGSTAYVLFMGALFLITELPAVLQFGIGLMLLGMVASVVRGRPHIAVGIAAAVFAVPLLFIGTCFAIVGMDFIRG